MHTLLLYYNRFSSGLHIRYTSTTRSRHCFAPKVCHICATEIRVKVPEGADLRSSQTTELTELTEWNRYWRFLTVNRDFYTMTSCLLFQEVSS